MFAFLDPNSGSFMEYFLKYSSHKNELKYFERTLEFAWRMTRAFTKTTLFNKDELS